MAISDPNGTKNTNRQRQRENVGFKVSNKSLHKLGQEVHNC